VTKEEQDKLKVETDKMAKDLDDLKKLNPELSEEDLFDKFAEKQLAPDPVRIVSTHCQIRDTYTQEAIDAAFLFFEGLKPKKI
jgi:hypothetical protein